jgi:hypothetical protein
MMKLPCNLIAIEKRPARNFYICGNWETAIIMANDSAKP